MRNIKNAFTLQDILFFSIGNTHARAQFGSKFREFSYEIPRMDVKQQTDDF